MLGGFIMVAVFALVLIGIIILQNSSNITCCKGSTDIDELSYKRRISGKDILGKLIVFLENVIFGTMVSRKIDKACRMDKKIYFLIL